MYSLEWGYFENLFMLYLCLISYTPVLSAHQTHFMAVALVSIHPSSHPLRRSLPHPHPLQLSSSATLLSSLTFVSHLHCHLKLPQHPIHTHLFLLLFLLYCALLSSDWEMADSLILFNRFLISKCVQVYLCYSWSCSTWSSVLWWE